MLSAFYKNTFLKKVNLYFVVSLILLLVFYFCNFPSLTYRAEPYAETGTTFFIQAMESSFFDNLFLSDAGYFALLPRLLAFFVVRIFNIINYYPFFVQMVAFLFIAFSSSLFNLKSFKKIIDSDLIRLIISIIVGLHWGYGMYLFHNFAQFGVVFAFLILFLI